MATVLILEEQPHLRQLLELELSDAGYRCLSVADHDHLTEVLTSENVDVVVLGGGGSAQEDLYTLCWVKNFSPTIPVILFAGIEVLQPKSIARLADAWVEKCSCLDPLIAKVRHLCKGVSKPSLAS